MNENGLNKKFLSELIFEVAGLVRSGKQVIIVTSGAVGFGKRLISFKGEKPYFIKTQQGLAAIGQVALMNEYYRRFESMGLECAQVLLSQQDLLNKDCFSNIKNTFDFLFENKVVAVVNENDVVATEELRVNGAFSDNDALASLLAKQIGADLLVMLTSKNGLIGKDGEILNEFNSIEDLCVMEKNLNDGRGGIDSKIIAIESTRAAGCNVFISGQDYFEGFSKGNSRGTFAKCLTR